MARKTYDKFKLLNHIFQSRTANGTRNIGVDIDFTLREVGEGIRETDGIPPTSWSNFVLDLTRKKNTINQRLPQEIIEYGYDLRKKTGVVPGEKGEKYCGTFVYRGKDENGMTIPIQDWLEWGNPDEEIIIKNDVPALVKLFISNDEASLFSVIDYCDILSKVLHQQVYRVQSPMKWQPNEIDGYYVAKQGRNIYVYPVEAKAVSTADDINIVQINGQYETFIRKYTKNDYSLIVRPIAVKMLNDGMLIAILEHNALYDPHRNKESQMFNILKEVRVKLDPPLTAWQ